MVLSSALSLNPRAFTSLRISRVGSGEKFIYFYITVTDGTNDDNGDATKIQITYTILIPFKIVSSETFGQVAVISTQDK